MSLACGRADASVNTHPLFLVLMPVARHGEPSEGARMCADEMRDLVKCALFGVRSFLIHANGSVIVLIPALFLTSSVVVASDLCARCAHTVCLF